MKAYYDLHIHTALSNCGKMCNTPCAIVKRAKENGLNVIAVCDHNNARNAEAVMRAGLREGIAVIPGMEITTKENVHILGLFYEVESAVELSEYLDKHRPLFAGPAEGETAAWLYDEFDRVKGIYPYGTANETDFTIPEVIDLIKNYGGAVIPSHVDRWITGILTVRELDGLALDGIEISRDATEEYLKEHPSVDRFFKLYNSDCHWLDNMFRAKHFLEVENLTVKDVLDAVKRENKKISAENNI